MTLVPQARLVLNDAIYIRNKLETKESTIEWRLNWVLVIVLLRTVGHVLVKIDGEAHQGVKREARRLFDQWKAAPEHSIFREFIELERNTILKEYATTMTHGPVPIVAHLQRHDGFDYVRQFVIEENLYRPMGAGKYAGEDGREILDEAISWWAKQLAEIDSRAIE